MRTEGDDYHPQLVVTGTRCHYGSCQPWYPAANTRWRDYKLNIRWIHYVISD